MPFPYIGIGVAAAQVITSIPSAELLFIIKDEAITIAGAGNEQAIVISCDLPRSFCYVLIESTLRITSVDADNWDKQMICNYTDSISVSDVSMPLTYEQELLGRDSVTSLARTYQLKFPPSKLIIPTKTDDAQLTIKNFNVVQAGAVGSLKFYARFLRFDRNQSQFWAVNSPILTR